MCWSEGASVAMVGLGAVATFVTARRGEPKAIPVTLAFFTFMEALQAAGYLVIDECQLGPNKAVTLLSYVHISLQPIFINAFGMSLAAAGVISPAMRRFVYAASGFAALVMLLSLVPFDWAGPCKPDSTLCGPEWCTLTGTWHLAWEMRLNDMWRVIYGETLSELVPFPAYVLAVFVLPLAYRAWRFVLFHAALGPILASQLTNNPNEVPAIWCLFSIGLIFVALSPLIRRSVSPGRAAIAA